MDTSTGVENTMEPDGLWRRAKEYEGFPATSRDKEEAREDPAQSLGGTTALLTP